jgi:hypothetical protein
MLQTLSAWSDVQPEYSLPPTASAETVHQGEFLNMPGSGDQSRNPYLRADSIPELLAWHDLDFVRCAYVTVLGRQPDRRGELYYVDRLRRGYSKLGILWQLRTSKEGPRHDPGIAGFDKELRKHRNARSPLYGWLIRAVTGREADTPLERRLRALENLIGSTRTAPAGPALSAELSSLVETLRALPSTAAAAPAAESAPSPEIQIVRGRLSPRAQKFYDRAVN